MQLFDMTKPKKSGNRVKKAGVCLLIAALMIGVAAIPVYSSEYKIAQDRQKVIVLDPGHGGSDNGAKGADGSLEKDAVLNLARMISKKLKPEYQVVFTRNGDYQVDLTQRTSEANHKKGDLFISIHAAGSSRHQTNQWSVFYSKAPQKTVDDNRMSPGGAKEPDQGRQPWDMVQVRHESDSKFFAQCIKNKLKNMPGISDVHISQMPLRVLEGADMPAIIIEAGYLTNPKTEKQLNDNGFLADVAVHIRKGIEQYFNSKN